MNDNKEYEFVFVLGGKIPELMIKTYWRIKNIFTKQEFEENLK